MHARYNQLFCSWSGSRPNHVLYYFMWRYGITFEKVGRNSESVWMKYNIFVTFYAWLVALSFPFLSFHIIFLLTSTDQTGEPISMVDGSNDAFPPKEVPFLGLIKEI
jgi:hypothetical protein